jgi:hypothetical protein
VKISCNTYTISSVSKQSLSLRQSWYHDDFDEDDYEEGDPAGEEENEEGMEVQSPRGPNERRLRKESQAEDEDEFIPSSTSDSSSSPTVEEMKTEVVDLTNDRTRELEQQLAVMKRKESERIEKKLKKRRRKANESSNSDEEEIEDEDDRVKKAADALAEAKKIAKSKKSSKAGPGGTKLPQGKVAGSKKRSVIPPPSSSTSAFTYTASKGDAADKSKSSKSKPLYGKPQSTSSRVRTGNGSSDDSSDDDSDDSPPPPPPPRTPTASPPTPSPPPPRAAKTKTSAPCSRYVEELLALGQPWGTVCTFCRWLVDQHSRQPGGTKSSGNEEVMD